MRGWGSNAHLHDEQAAGDGLDGHAQRGADTNGLAAGEVDLRALLRQEAPGKEPRGAELLRLHDDLVR